MTIGQGLERYASFYANHFGIPKPTKFITVYIVTDESEMQRAFDGQELQDLLQSAEERQYFRRQTINHATARYLMLYLQENGKLVDVYKASGSKKVDDLKDGPEQEAVRLLASVVQKSLPEFDKDFGRWFLGLR